VDAIRIQWTDDNEQHKYEPDNEIINELSFELKHQTLKETFYLDLNKYYFICVRYLSN